MANSKRMQDLLNEHTYTAHTYDLWEASERVAQRLEKSSINNAENWRTLESVTRFKVSINVWNNLSLFLTKCNDKEFERFFGKFNHKELELGEFLEILHDNNSSGEEIFAFLLNISPLISGRRNKKIDLATELVRKKLRSDPDFDLVKVGEIYQLILGVKRNTFINYSERKKFFEKY